LAGSRGRPTSAFHSALAADSPSDLPSSGRAAGVLALVQPDDHGGKRRKGEDRKRDDLHADHGGERGTRFFLLTQFSHEHLVHSILFENDRPPPSASTAGEASENAAQVDQPLCVIWGGNAEKAVSSAKRVTFLRSLSVAGGSS
jgi:hypothetical protein